MKISYSQIEEQCNELHSIANNMNEIINEFKNKTSGIGCSEIWSGEAALFYKSKLDKVLLEYENIFIELENSILFLANCAEGYKAIDENILKDICSNLNITEPNLSTTKIYNEV